MRIALLSSEWRSTGGVASYGRSLAHALAQSGHDVLVVHGESVPMPSDARIDLRAVPGALMAGAAGDSALTRRAADTVLGFAPDVVHVLSNNNFPLERALAGRR